MFENASGGLAVALLWSSVEVAKLFMKSRQRSAHATLDERKLLSVDEREFRREILTELANVRAELALCQRQHAESLIERDRMAEKLEQLERQGKP